MFCDIKMKRKKICVEALAELQFQQISVYCIYPHCQVSNNIGEHLKANLYITLSLLFLLFSLLSQLFVLELFFLYHRLVSFHQHSSHLSQMKIYVGFSSKNCFLQTHLLVARAVEKEDASSANPVGERECPVSGMGDNSNWDINAKVNL